MRSLDRIFRRATGANSAPIAQQVKNIIESQARLHQCVWLDPSDLSTMYQDAAGTVPVTGVGQSIGLILDKSKGLATGPGLTANGEFNFGGGWTISNIGTGSAAISGGHLVLVGVDAANRGRVYQVVTCEVGKSYKFSSSASGAASSVGIGYGIGQTGLAAINGGQSCVFTAAATSVYVTLYNTSSGGTAYIDNISVSEIYGNHASQATGASQPILRQDANGARYLKFDGVDDFLVSMPINLSTSSKITVSASLRKLSDAASSVVVESSANYAEQSGTFAMWAPLTGSPNVAFTSRGTSSATAVAGALPSPSSLVASGVGNISAQFVKARVGGAQAAQAVSTQGGGQYGNHPLYIGRRAGSSLSFAGHLYGLCVLGGLDDIPKLAKIERYLASKMGISL